MSASGKSSNRHSEYNRALLGGGGHGPYAGMGRMDRERRLRAEREAESARAAADLRRAARVRRVERLARALGKESVGSPRWNAIKSALFRLFYGGGPR